MQAWTDYPIVELGDVPNKEAPIRACEVLGWDGDKYASVVVAGVRTSFKVGYVYDRPGRCGEVPRIATAGLAVLPLC
jgi:hypothetical protein